MNGIEADKYYSIGECSRLTGLGYDLLLARCNGGHLAHLRPPGVKNPRRLVKGVDLIEFLRASGAKVPRPAPPKANGPRRKTADREELDALRELGCM